MVTGVIANSTSPDIPAGIYIVGAVGSNTRLYNNSVSMTGNRGVTNGQMPSYGIAITGADPTVELKNNIFYTTQTAGCATACPTAESYAIGMVSTAFTNLDSNYNLFFTNSGMSQDGGYRSGSLALAAGTDYDTLALWQAAVSDDANSLDTDPFFVAPLNDLHLQNTPAPNPEGGLNAPTAISPAIDAGTPIAAVTDDFDGNIRTPGSQFDIGGDEVTAPTASGVTVSGRILTADGRPIRQARMTLVNVLTGDTLETQTDEQGAFEFDDNVLPGATYSLTVAHRSYTFASPTRVFNVAGDLEGIIYFANKRTTRGG
jgi:hypothetical protein